MKLRSAILCDDIRQEVGGKNTIVGAYPGDVQVGRFPVQLPLSIWMNYYREQKFPKTISVKVEFPGEGSPLSGEIKVSDTGTYGYVLSLERIPMTVAEPGLIRCKVKADDSKRWTTAGSWKVSQRVESS